LADELIIQGLRVPGEDGTALIVIDAIVETDFSKPDQVPSHENICREIDRLSRSNPPGALESTATTMIEGLLDRFPDIQGIELTMRSLEPNLPGFVLDAIGVRKRQRRPKPPQRLARRDIKPLPR
jgi:hypothetical protein